MASNPGDNTKKGRIMHALSGFYYVEADNVLYTCKAKGVFRKKGVTPLPGDEVIIETDGENGTVAEILPRKSELKRPPVANIDLLFIVSSADKPKPNILVIDKLTALAEFSGIEPVIIFSKGDLADVTEYKNIYEKAGFKVIVTAPGDDASTEEIRALASGRICCFTGNTGVGKSTLINRLMPQLGLETNEISEKLGRGRHTTRSISLYKAGSALIADTPGFSALEFEQDVQYIPADSLPDCFPEFSPFSDKCRFYPSCSHVNDKGCAVKAAAEEGIIPQSRRESYIKMYSEVKDIKPWEIKKS